MAEHAADFFIGEKQNAILYETPKLDKKKSTITLGFSMPLTAEAIKEAPESVKEAFYSVQKDSLGLNPIGIDSQFQDVTVSFFATKETKAANLETSGAKIKKMEVSRPDHKTFLDDGDVRLSFRLLVPASQETWKWGYSNFKAEVAVLFEDMNPLLPHIREEKSDEVDENQGVLEMQDHPADNPPAKNGAAKKKPAVKAKSKKKK
jgi:hypothetical protein